MFEEIAATHASIGAYDVLARLAEKGTRLAPISVYRAIDALIEAGVIHRLESKNAYFACRRMDHRTGRRPIFLSCEKCNAVQEVDSEGIFDTIDRAGARRFLPAAGEVRRSLRSVPQLRAEEGLRPLMRRATEWPPRRPSRAGTITIMPARIGTGRQDAAAPFDPTALISARGLCISRHGRDLLIDVDLDIRAREIVTLIGPNGAGKTTLVRVLLGLEKPDRGKVHRRKDLRIGYVPQRFDIDAVIPMTVERFLMLGSSVSPSAIGEMPGAGRRRNRVRNQQLGELSGGELQRVVLARALLRKPNLLVLDEPVQGVDYTGEADLYNLIARLRDEARLRRAARLARSARRHGALRPGHLPQPARLLLGRAGDGRPASGLRAAVRRRGGARLRRLSPSPRSQPRSRRHAAARSGETRRRSGARRQIGA